MKKLLSLFLFLTVSGTVLAQAPDPLEIFQQAAGDQSVLFRGKQATRISFPANGNPYWESPEFRQGDILFEGNLYRDLLLNVDARTQRALVMKSFGLSAVALTPAQTTSFTMGDRHFVGIGPGEALPEGFYQVFGTGAERVYKHVEKILGSSVENVNGAAIGYTDPNYRSDVYRHFAIKTTYYFRNAEGEFSRLKGRGALLRKFRERRKDIRKTLKAAGIGSSTNFDAYCQAVLEAAAR